MSRGVCAYSYGGNGSPTDPFHSIAHLRVYRALDHAQEKWKALVSASIQSQTPVSLWLEALEGWWGFRNPWDWITREAFDEVMGENGGTILGEWRVVSPGTHQDIRPTHARPVYGASYSYRGVKVDVELDTTYFFKGLMIAYRPLWVLVDQSV